MHNIVWLESAQQDKDAALTYIAQYSVLAALGIDEQIEQQVSQLKQFPHLGRKGRLANTFELLITGTPYIAAYRVLGNTVQILHVFHTRRDWPPQEK